MVGPAFKTMKSEFVAWQEAIRAKKVWSAWCKTAWPTPEGDFTERNMNSSQQTWVKTFMQDVMDEKGQVLFENLAWFAKKLCSVMTSVFCMWAYVEHRRVDTQQAQAQIGATKCGKGIACPWQPRPQEGYVAIQAAESHVGLADTHQWTGTTHKLTNEQGVDDSDDDDINSDSSIERQDQQWLSE